MKVNFGIIHAAGQLGYYYNNLRHLKRFEEFYVIKQSQSYSDCNYESKFLNQRY